ncbi:MAG: hypothetical protein AAGB10_07380, partial [Pseudomonadota bacterium]
MIFAPTGALHGNPPESSGGFPAPLRLAVAADNVDAIRFYERFGFVRTELRRAVWERRMGPVADALIMTLVA